MSVQHRAAASAPPEAPGKRAPAILLLPLILLTAYFLAAGIYEPWQPAELNISQLRFMLGKQHAARRDWPAARAQYEQAVALDPRSLPAHYQAAQVCRELGDTSAAASHLRACLALCQARGPAMAGLARRLAAELQALSATSLTPSP